MAISLGGVLLDGFEVNPPISFGGRQAMAIHKLPGGARIIDAMGPDDAAIGWRGILTGANASSRARAIDAFRVAGVPVTLGWDVFTATVIVSDLQLEFCNSWWVRYRLKCTVVIGTESSVTIDVNPPTIADVFADLNQISAAPGIAVALAATGIANAAVSGSQAYATAMIALNSAAQDIQASLSAADDAMSAGNIQQLVQSASNLAFLTQAAGYIGRAQTNFSDIQQ